VHLFLRVSSHVLLLRVSSHVLLLRVSSHVLLLQCHALVIIFCVFGICLGKPGCDMGLYVVFSYWGL
jgi:hypothetical protein